MQQTLFRKLSSCSQRKSHLTQLHRQKRGLQECRRGRGQSLNSSGPAPSIPYTGEDVAPGLTRQSQGEREIDHLIQGLVEMGLSVAVCSLSIRVRHLRIIFLQRRRVFRNVPLREADCRAHKIGVELSIRLWPLTPSSLTRRPTHIKWSGRVIILAKPPAPTKSLRIRAALGPGNLFLARFRIRHFSFAAWGTAG